MLTNSKTLIYKTLLIITIPAILSSCSDRQSTKYGSIPVDYYHQYDSPQFLQPKNQDKPEPMGYGKFGRGDEKYLKNKNYDNKQVNYDNYRYDYRTRRPYITPKKIWESNTKDIRDYRNNKEIYYRRYYLN